MVSFAPASVLGPQAEQYLLMVRRVGEIAHLMCGSTSVSYNSSMGFVSLKKIFCGPSSLAFGVESTPLLHGRHLVHVVNVLRIGNLGHVVAEVFVALVADSADEIVGLVHAVARGVDVIARGSLLFAQERAALHV